MAKTAGHLEWCTTVSMAATTASGVLPRIWTWLAPVVADTTTPRVRRLGLSRSGPHGAHLVRAGPRVASGGGTSGLWDGRPGLVPLRRPSPQPTRPLWPPQAAEDRCGLTRPARPAVRLAG